MSLAPLVLYYHTMLPHKAVQGNTQCVVGVDELRPGVVANRLGHKHCGHWRGAVGCDAVDGCAGLQSRVVSVGAVVRHQQRRLLCFAACPFFVINIEIAAVL